jgi:hypothetical protein
MTSYSSSNTYFKNIRTTRLKLKATLKSIDKCSMKSYIDKKSIKPIVKNSASSTLIILGKLNADTTTNIDKEEDKEFVIKASFISNDVRDNSLKVETQIYDNIIGKILNDNMTPCLIDKIVSFKCTKDKLPEIYLKLYEDVKNMGDLDSFDTSIINLLMLEKTSGLKNGKGPTTLYKFLEPMRSKMKELKPDREYNSDNELNIVSIMFQLLWTFKVFNSLRFKHNDLHFNNIFIEEIDNPIYMFFLKNKGSDDCYVLKTKYIVKIYDFDRSSIVSYPGIDRNLSLDTFMCKNNGECNYMSSKFDLHTCLQEFIRWLPDVCNFKTNFLQQCFDDTKLEVRTVEGSEHLLAFGEVDPKNYIRPVDDCLKLLIDFYKIISKTTSKSNRIIDDVKLSPDEKKKYKYCIFTCPTKTNIILYNPTSRETNKPLTLEYDSLIESEVYKKYTYVKTNINRNLLNNKILFIWKFELSLIENFNWSDEETTLFVLYIETKEMKIDIQNIDKLIIAFKLLSCPIYYKINNDKYIETILKDEKDSDEDAREYYNDIKIFIADIWNTFNNVLPIKIPLL